MRPFNMRWKGMLTKGNAEDVAKLFRLLLTHHKFTYVSARPQLLPKLSEECPSYVDTRVEVCTNRKLVYENRDEKGRKKSAVQVSYHENSTSILISTPDYLVMYDTRLEGEHAQYDHLHKNPYVAFDGDRVTIKHQTPCGDQVVEMFIL
jgi:hypothetical protein